MTETQQQPLITVVTVSYNAAKTIEQTMLSVLNQTYPNIEYIIIDGGSTDGTVDIIKKYADRLAYWVSEPDKGIYDAMNKGIGKATGEWINFMNSGDRFCSNNSIMSIFFNAIGTQYRVIYGGYQTIDEKLMTQNIFPENIDTLEYKMAFCHQSSFVRRSLLKNRPFNTKYKLVADYVSFRRIYKKYGKEVFLLYKNCISVFDKINGVSNNNFFLIHIEYMRSRKIIGNLQWIVMNFLSIYKKKFK